MKHKHPHLDSVQNGFFARDLEQIRQQAFEVQYPELKGMMLVPVNSNFHPGAVEYTYRVYDGTGTAVIAATGVARGPRVDVFGFETTAKFKRFIDAYAYDKEEVRNSLMAGNSLPARKALIARKALAVKLDNALLLGSAGPDDLVTSGFSGLFTASGTLTYTLSTGTAGTTFAGKTPDEIVNDLIGMENSMVTQTNEVEQPDTLVLPLDCRPQMQSRMGDGSDVTVIKHYLGNTDLIKSVVYSQKLNSSSAWSGRRVVMYKRSPEKLEGCISIEFGQEPPQFVGWETIVECESKTAGTVIYVPKSIIYGDGA